MHTKGYLIRAFIKSDGTHFIDINPFYTSDPDNLRQFMKSEISCYQDWQCSTHKNLKEVRSCLMLDYGMGWFNRGRKRIKELEAMNLNI